VDYINVGFIDVYNAYGNHRRLNVTNPRELWRAFGKDKREIHLKHFPPIVITGMKLVGDTVYVEGRVEHNTITDQEKRLAILSKMIDFYSVK
jgi:uncharacterized protein YktB (UPF0637 family)